MLTPERECMIESGAEYRRGMSVILGSAQHHDRVRAAGLVSALPEENRGEGDEPRQNEQQDDGLR
jgi:hypothetical protein